MVQQAQPAPRSAQDLYFQDPQKLMQHLLSARGLRPGNPFYNLAMQRYTPQLQTLSLLYAQPGQERVMDQFEDMASRYLSYNLGGGGGGPYDFSSGAMQRQVADLLGGQLPGDALRQAALRPGDPEEQMRLYAALQDLGAQGMHPAMRAAQAGLTQQAYTDWERQFYRAPESFDQGRDFIDWLMGRPKWVNPLAPGGGGQPGGAGAPAGGGAGTTAPAPGGGGAGAPAPGGTPGTTPPPGSGLAGPANLSAITRKRHPTLPGAQSFEAGGYSYTPAADQTRYWWGKSGKATGGYTTGGGKGTKGTSAHWRMVDRYRRIKAGNPSISDGDALRRAIEWIRGIYQSKGINPDLTGFRPSQGAGASAGQAAAQAY